MYDGDRNDSTYLSRVDVIFGEEEEHTPPMAYDVRSRWARSLAPSSAVALQLSPSSCGEVRYKGGRRVAGIRQR